MVHHDNPPLDMLSLEKLISLRAEPAEPNRLRMAMRLAGFTQVWVAGAVGITQSYVSDICNGNYKSLPVEIAQRLASLFGPNCTVDDLFPLPLVLREKPDRRAPDSPLRRATDSPRGGA